MDCYRRRRRYPKSNVGIKCVSVTKTKSSSSSRARQKRRTSTSRKHHRMKNSFIPSNLYSNDFYPANYFFQNDKVQPKFEFNGSSRGGVNCGPYNTNHRAYNSMINLNTPHSSQLQQHQHQLHHQHRWHLPSSRMLMSRSFYNNRKVSSPHVDFDNVEWEREWRFSVERTWAPLTTSAKLLNGFTRACWFCKFPHFSHLLHGLRELSTYAIWNFMALARLCIQSRAQPSLSSQ